jgi:hypothetical protein
VIVRLRALVFVLYCNRYLTVLPSVHLSVAVSPDEAVAMRHPAEMEATSPFLQGGSWEDNIPNRDVAGDDSIKAGSGMGSDDVSTSSNKSSPLDMVFQRLVSETLQVCFFP